MNWFKNIKAFTRIQLLVSILFTSMFLITATFIFVERKQNLKQEVQSKMDRELSELSGIINIYIKRDRDLLNLAQTVAESRINDYSDIEEIEGPDISFEAVDPYANLPIMLKIKDWKINNSAIVNNYLLVDEINRLTKVDVSIYQKCDIGYVNVSTSILNLTEERLTGDIVLNSSQITKTVEQGNQYIGRIYQRNSWYLASYKPIYIDGQIKGMFYIGIKERIGRALNDIFASRVYFKTGYPFLINKQGNLLVHPERQGEDFSTTELFKHIIDENQQGKVLLYKWPENEDGKWWYLHFQFHPGTQSYICASYPKNELNEDLLFDLIYAIIGYILFIILLQVLFYLVNNSMRSKLKKLRLVVSMLAKGEKPEVLKIEGEKEFVEMSDKLNHVSLRFKDLEEFANGLVDGNFTQKYPKTFINDEIGEALIKINDKLNEAMYNEHIRVKEEKLRIWESDGLSKFVNILQRNRDNLEELCYEIIMNLVQYLNANLGALFFINSDDLNNIFFEQMATFAFDQKRLIEKKIYPEQGLIGRIFNEKKTIYLTEIPDGYISISSGLGESTPKNLLIVPLLVNQEVYGAIEIASFNIIKGFQIEFIEKIGENIASTINNVLVNNKTRELLKQSRAQSELLSNQEEEMRRNLLELKNIQKESNAGLYEKREVYKTLDQILLLIEIDHEGVILSVNDYVPAFFTMEKANLIGKHFSDYSYFVPVDEYKNLIAKWELLKSGENVQIELKVKSGIGKMSNMMVNILPEMNKEKLVKIIVMGVEISSN